MLSEDADRIAIAQQQIPDPLGEAWEGFPNYLDGIGNAEVGLRLDEFSPQLNFVKDIHGEKLKTHLGLTSYRDATKIIEFFGANRFGGVVEYSWGTGYNPAKIREHQLSNWSSSSSTEPFSELLRSHNMAEYGSGGLPGPVSREIEYGLSLLLKQAAVICPELASISAILIEVARGFASAGLCLSTGHENDEGVSSLYWMAVIIAGDAGSATASTSMPGWRELIKSLIKSTNFCPSRQLAVNTETHRQSGFKGSLVKQVCTGSVSCYHAE
ncbi:hypothetical protein BGX24_002882 [Mortierella sp. AD032]|nr:hypothetical protein BGX24_002882 [Mortierella sp. AD032]